MKKTCDGKVLIGMKITKDEYQHDKHQLSTILKLFRLKTAIYNICITHKDIINPLERTKEDADIMHGNLDRVLAGEEFIYIKPRKVLTIQEIVFDWKEKYGEKISNFLKIEKHILFQDFSIFMHIIEDEITKFRNNWDKNKDKTIADLRSFSKSLDIPKGQIIVKTPDNEYGFEGFETSGIFVRFLGFMQCYPENITNPENIIRYYLTIKNEEVELHYVRDLEEVDSEMDPDLKACREYQEKMRIAEQNRFNDPDNFEQEEIDEEEDFDGAVERQYQKEQEQIKHDDIFYSIEEEEF